MDGPEEAGWAPAASSIYQQLETEILDGVLLPTSVISEPVLSQRFGVSRAPLREAIWRLEKHGLVVRPPRQRARVVSISPERLREIFALREAVEGMAAREAAGRMTEERLGELRAALDRRDRPADPAAHGRPGPDFHASIARASGNGFIQRVLDEHHGLIELCRRRQRRSPERNERSRIEHRRILGALEDRDGDMAELTMRRHIASARTMLLDAFE